MALNKYVKLARRMKQMIDEIDDCFDKVEKCLDFVQLHCYEKQLVLGRPYIKETAFKSMVKTHYIGLQKYSPNPDVKDECSIKPWLGAILIRPFYMRSQCFYTMEGASATDKWTIPWSVKIVLPKDGKGHTERARKRALLYCPIYIEISDEIDWFEDGDLANSITYQLFQIGQYYAEQGQLKQNLVKDALPYFKKVVDDWHGDENVEIHMPKKIDGVLAAGFAPNKTESLAIAYEKVKRAIREKKFRNYGPLLTRWLDKIKELVFENLPWSDARKVGFLKEWDQNIFGKKKALPNKSKGMGRWVGGRSIDDELASRFIRYFVNEFITDHEKEHSGEIACILWLAVWSSVEVEDPSATLKNIVELKIENLNLSCLEISLGETIMEVSSGLVELLEILTKGKRPNDYLFERTVIDRLEDALKDASKKLLPEGDPSVLPEAFLIFPHPYRGVRIPKKQRLAMMGSKDAVKPKLFPSRSEIKEALTCHSSV